MQRQKHKGTNLTHDFGLGTNGSFRNLRNTNVHFSATSDSGKVSMYSASFPEIQPNNTVSFTFENEYIFLYQLSEISSVNKYSLWLDYLHYFLQNN